MLIRPRPITTSSSFPRKTGLHPPCPPGLMKLFPFTDMWPDVSLFGELIDIMLFIYSAPKHACSLGKGETSWCALCVRQMPTS